jgi:predicted ATP-grasp superfamily ATP-dependent carboligase
MRSRHGTKIVCPDPSVDQVGWVRSIIDIARQCKQKPLIIPVSDTYVLALERTADELRDHVKFHGFGAGLRARLTSKRSTFEMAAKHDFPTPATIYVNDAEHLRSLWRRVQAPILIKPEFSKHWRTPAAEAAIGFRKAIIANTEQELIDVYDRVRPLTEQLMAQEVIPGPDRNLLYWAGFVGENGRVGGRIVGRKIRVFPVHLGSASFVKLEDMPEVEANCEDFLSAVGYQGICGIELKLDERDGIAKLIEVNPRYGLWDDIGVPEGVDLAEEALLAVSGQITQARRPTRFRQKWINVEKDLKAFKSYRAEGSLGLLEWLASLSRPILVDDLPVFADPPYARHNLRSFVTRRFL